MLVEAFVRDIISAIRIAMRLSRAYVQTALQLSRNFTPSSFAIIYMTLSALSIDTVFAIIPCIGFLELLCGVWNL